MNGSLVYLYVYFRFFFELKSFKVLLLKLFIFEFHLFRNFFILLIFLKIVLKDLSFRRFWLNINLHFLSWLIFLCFLFLQKILYLFLYKWILLSLFWLLNLFIFFNNHFNFSLLFLVNFILFSFLQLLLL